MKITWINVWLCFALFLSCKSERKTFTVAGKIKHATGAIVYLKQISIGEKNPVVIGTDTLDKDGSFTITTTATNEEYIHALTVANGPDIYVINDANSINVQADLHQYKKYTVEGSVASNLLHQFLDHYSEAYPSLVKAIYNADSVEKAVVNDSVLQVYQTAKTKEVEKVNGIIIETLKQSKSAALDAYLLTKAMATMDKELIANYVRASQEKYSSNPNLAVLSTIVKREVAKIPKYDLLNKQAPAINLKDTSGKSFVFDSLKGKYILIDFWASWCAPCRAENPNLVALYKQFKTKNFEIVGVSLDKEKTDWQAAIKKDKLTWPQISDLKEWDSEVVNLYKINGIPFNVLLDTTGKIIAFDLKGKDLQKKLQSVLK